MNSFFILDEKFSTTKRLIQDKTAIKEGTLLTLPLNSQRITQGGLRTKGYLKKNFENIPLISIITIVYNGTEFLEETIQSVLLQTYVNVEYIIIDGGSTDGTIDIIQKYEDQIDYWVSEEDKGIYDAMNKGIDLANGDWINFMNAGDNFNNNGVLHQVFYQNDFQESTFIYGDTEVDYGKFTKLQKKGVIRDFAKGMQFTHQSVFIKCEYHKINKLNINNRIIADFEFFYTSWMKKRQFFNVDIIISTISVGGVSDIKRFNSILARWKVVGYSNINISFFYLSLLSREMFKKIFKSIIGKNLTMQLTLLLKR